MINIVRKSTPRFTKSPSLVLIRLVLTEIQAFKNEKNLQRNVSKCGRMRTLVRICPHFHFHLSRQAPFLDLQDFYRVKPGPLFGFTGFLQSQAKPSFLIYRVFTESSQAPFLDLQGFYRVKPGPLFGFTGFLQSQSKPSFSIYRVFTGSSQIPFLDLQGFYRVNPSLFFDLQGFYRVKPSLFTFSIYTYVHDRTQLRILQILRFFVSVAYVTRFAIFC